MNVFDIAKARLLARTAVIEVEIEPTLEVEFTPQLTLGEIVSDIANEIGTRALLQELN